MLCFKAVTLAAYQCLTLIDELFDVTSLTIAEVDDNSFRSVVRLCHCIGKHLRESADNLFQSGR